MGTVAIHTNRPELLKDVAVVCGRIVLVVMDGILNSCFCSGGMVTKLRWALLYSDEGEWLSL